MLDFQLLSSHFNPKDDKVNTVDHILFYDRIHKNMITISNLGVLMTTLKQKIAQKKDELARLEDRDRKLENGQKIITGGVLLSIARKNPERAKMLLDDYNNEITRKTDLDRIQPIIDELKKTIAQSNEQPQQQHSTY